MKSSHIFWGIFFLLLGALILLDNYTSLYFDWETLLKLSPIILILWGISFLVRQSKFLSGFFAFVTGIIFAIAVFSGFKVLCETNGWNFDINFNDDNEITWNGGFDSTFYSTPYKGARNVYLNFEGKASAINISNTTADLIEGFGIGAGNKYEFNVERSNSAAKIYFDLEEIDISFEDNENEIELKLNKNPIWSFDFDLGASDVDFDLTNFKVEKISIDAGAASIDMKLGNLTNSTKIDIDAGASSIDIKIPKSSGCQITTDAFLSSEDFYGFTETNSGKFRTENFDSSEKKIFINIDSGVSSIDVERY